MNWRKVLLQLKYWQSIDNKQQLAMNDYCKILAPNEYAPILDSYCVNAFLDGLTDNNDLRDWLTYWLYEVPMLKGSAIVKQDNKQYNFKRQQDVIKFFKNNY